LALWTLRSRVFASQEAIVINFFFKKKVLIWVLTM
jgi:hypothetical protein